ncbi:TROVE domain-containing protein [Actinosynnema sp. NPDC059797]
MSKFNFRLRRRGPTSPVTTATRPSGRTHEGGPGYARDTRSELFLLAVSNMGGEETFYETSGERDTRYADLVRAAALTDPGWTARFLSWLRGEGNLRTASLVGAAEFVKARLDAGASGVVANRAVVDSVLRRADEPGELLAYWTATHGRAVPKPVKRGIADAARRLYDERSLVKWDSDARGFRFGDVLDLAHPSPRAAWQGELFRHALDVRHGRAGDVPAALPLLTARAELMSWPAERRRELFASAGAADVLRRAGMTWESVAGWLQGPMTKEVWEALIPSMGYTALLRNLRNFDEAGVSDEVAERVAARLADPGEVARSRQFPFRFLSAFETAPSLRWGHALDLALRASLRNLPPLPGRSLVLVDTSGSMQNALSQRSRMTAVKAAAVFGVALAAKGERVDLHGFATGVFRHEHPAGGSVLKGVAGLVDRVGEAGHGTDVAGALRATYRGHDRVFVISDMQTVTGPGGREVSAAVPGHVPLYGFNLVGYRPAAYATGGGNRHEFGGLSDATFRAVPLLEAGRDADWPF